MPKENTRDDDVIDDELLDDDLNDGDNDDDDGASKGPKVGEQEDGSHVVEIKDDEGDDNKGKEKKTDAEDDRVTTGLESDDDKDLAAKREARRQERQDRKRRQHERTERLQSEVRAEREARVALEARLAEIERRNTGAEMAQLDNALKQTRDAHAYFKEQIAVGQTNGDGKMVADATEKMVRADQRVQQLEGIKKSYSQRQNQPGPLDPTLVANANAFMEKHKWFKPESRDNDSVVLRALDNQVAAEGWDPTTPTYWQELENRLKKYLPHRIKSAKVQNNADDDVGDEEKARAKPKSTNAGSGRDERSSSSNSKGTFRLSADRVQAIKDAGMWDEPKQREDMIRRYRDFDKKEKERSK